MPACPCLANGIRCKYMCKLQTCSNQVPEEEEALAEVHEDEDETDNDDLN